MIKIEALFKFEEVVQQSENTLLSFFKFKDTQTQERNKLLAGQSAEVKAKEIRRQNAIQTFIKGF